VEVSPRTSVWKGRIWPRLLLVVAGLLVGLTFGEFCLVALGLPRIHGPRDFPSQFLFWSFSDDGAAVYTNYPDPAGIKFVYDSNPRGYFSVDNSLTHWVNPWGFRDVRGEPPVRKSVEQSPAGTIFRGIETKPPRRVRLLFLGDSLTFGEGVRDADVYPQVTAAALSGLARDGHFPSGTSFEAINMGVSGYNTRQSLYALEHWGAQFSPDVVILGYSLNDTEGPLWRDNPTGGRPRRDHVRDVQMGAAGALAPPSSRLFRFRTVRILWHAWHTRSRTQATIAYYRSLYEPHNPYLEMNMAALDGIVAFCRERGIPCVVLCFPVLHQLDDTYPFADVHESLRQRVESGGADFIDLLEELKGRRARDLWVHPSDPHPNEEVHAAAAEALTQLIVSGTSRTAAFQGQESNR
jgi:lysophospholipase L1-like esterase